MFLRRTNQKTNRFCAPKWEQDPLLERLIFLSSIERQYRQNFQTMRQILKEKIQVGDEARYFDPASEHEALMRELRRIATLYLLVREKRKKLFRSFANALKNVNDNRPSPYIFLS